MLSSPEIICPHCGEKITIAESLSAQIEQPLRAKLESERQKNLVELNRQKELLAQQVAAIDKKQDEIESIIAEKLKNQIALAEQKIREQLQRQITENIARENAEKVAFLQQQLTEQDQKLKAARAQEITLLQAQRQLQEERENFELQKQRELGEVQQKIAAEESAKANKAVQNQIEALQKQLSDSQKSALDLQRKLEQGSQQTQGEILELRIEDFLRTHFPTDEITEVKKGERGADLVQTVRGSHGENCGKIVWEIKNTKSWSNEWLAKLKNDQRAIHAEIAVLVSATLPKEIQDFGEIDDIYILSLAERVIFAAAILLRRQLLATTRERQIAQGQNGKMENIYHYLSGTQFRQRIEAVVECFEKLRRQTDKERAYFAKKWAEEDKLLFGVIEQMSGMYGDITGMVQLPVIAALSLPQLENADL